METYTGANDNLYMLKQGTEVDVMTKNTEQTRKKCIINHDLWGI